MSLDWLFAWSGSSSKHKIIGQIYRHKENVAKVGLVGAISNAGFLYLSASLTSTHISIKQLSILMLLFISVTFLPSSFNGFSFLYASHERDWATGTGRQHCWQLDSDGAAAATASSTN